MYFNFRVIGQNKIIFIIQFAIWFDQKHRQKHLTTFKQLLIQFITFLHIWLHLTTMSDSQIQPIEIIENADNSNDANPALKRKAEEELPNDQAKVSKVEEKKEEEDQRQESDDEEEENGDPHFVHYKYLTKDVLKACMRFSEVKEIPGKCSVAYINFDWDLFRRLLKEDAPPIDEIKQRLYSITPW